MRRMSMVVAGAVLAACARTPPPDCVTVDLTCAPLYTPTTFDDVYNRTIATGCGTLNSSCHSDAGRQGGMSLFGEANAYQALLARSSLDGPRPRVMPGNAACSLMIVRTEGVGQPYQMPVGDPLSPAERCALVQWVQNGAPGPGSGSAQ